MPQKNFDAMTKKLQHLQKAVVLPFSTNFAKSNFICITRVEKFYIGGSILTSV